MSTPLHSPDEKGISPWPPSSHQPSTCKSHHSKGTPQRCHKMRDSAQQRRITLPPTTGVAPPPLSRLHAYQGSHYTHMRMCANRQNQAVRTTHTGHLLSNFCTDYFQLRKCTPNSVSTPHCSPPSTPTVLLLPPHCTFTPLPPHSHLQEPSAHSPLWKQLPRKC